MMFSEELIESFSCNFCFNSFASENKLLLHEYVHKKLEEYKCLQCEKVLATKGSWKQHIQRS